MITVSISFGRIPNYILLELDIAASSVSLKAHLLVKEHLAFHPFYPFHRRPLYKNRNDSWTISCLFSATMRHAAFRIEFTCLHWRTYHFHRRSLPFDFRIRDFVFANPGQVAKPPKFPVLRSPFTDFLLCNLPSFFLHCSADQRNRKIFYKILSTLQRYASTTFVRPG